MGVEGLYQSAPSIGHGVWIPAFAGMTNKKGPGRNRGPICSPGCLSLLVGALLERGAENVAQRGARVGRTILRDRFLLFGDFQRADRHLHLVGAAIELRDAGVHLLTDLIELRPLLFSIAYRMVGRVSEAEDIVQEAFLRYQRAVNEGEEIDSPKAFLSTVTTRIAIDYLRSARAQRDLGATLTRRYFDLIAWSACFVAAATKGWSSSIDMLRPTIWVGR